MKKMTAWLAICGGCAALPLAISSTAIAEETPAEVTTTDTLSGYFANEFAEYSAWEDAMARASAEAEVEIEMAEPIAIPEPSAFALLGCLGALLLAMTLMRWYFDRAGDTAAVVADSPQTGR